MFHMRAGTGVDSGELSTGRRWRLIRSRKDPEDITEGDCLVLVPDPEDPALTEEEEEEFLVWMLRMMRKHQFVPGKWRIILNGPQARGGQPDTRRAIHALGVRYKQEEPSKVVVKPVD
jgi:hypothetical protein